LNKNSPPIRAMTLTEKFLQCCERFSQRVAVVDEKGPVSYGELLEITSGLARIVQKSSQQRVGICLPNCKEFVASYFALLFNGITPVIINPLLSPSQIAYIVEDASINTIITVSPFKDLLSGSVKDCIYLDLMPPSPEVSPTASPAPYIGKGEDIAAIFYTSGTSANPKGVMLTHKNILSDLEGCLPAFAFSDRDVILGVLPLFHTFAFTVTLVLPLLFSATVLYISRFSGPKVLEYIERDKVTVLLTIPSMYRAILRAAQTSTHDLSSLRLAVTGGEPVPIDLLNTFHKVFSVPLLEGYGLTEASPIVSVNTPTSYKYGTAGRPLPNIEVMIVGDNGHGLPHGKEGEVWVRGPNIMKGYLNLPELTRQTITPEGWLKTGDYGKFDEEGFLKITGRKKELIIISGENVAPAEIEEVICRYPGVFEAAVVGVPDRFRGEVPKAYVVAHPNTELSEAELREHCHKHLPHYKVPRYFEFRKELPHGPTGKILKRAL
jgi:long-chain acyl-CoA synthetase